MAEEQSPSPPADAEMRTQSGYYDAYWTSGWVTCSAPPVLIELFERHLTATDSCLDVGCGDAGTSGAWINGHTARYVGVDISSSAVEKARGRGLEAEVIEDASSLPFEDDSFDAAVCSEVLEHLFNPQDALAEIHRVLRPGGRLILSVPNAAHWRNRLDLMFFGRFNPRGDHLSGAEPWRDPHVRFFSLGALERLVRASGFRTIESGGHSQFALIRHLPVLRSLSRQEHANATTARIARRFPRVLAETIYVVGEAGQPARG